MSRNVAQILYDGYGNPHSVLVDDVIYPTTPGLIVAGKDPDGLAQFLSVSSDGEMTTAQRSVQSQYDIGGTVGTTYTYIGVAERGLATSSVGWTIKRFEFLDGTLQAKKITDSKAAIWDNRVSETYS